MARTLSAARRSLLALTALLMLMPGRVGHSDDSILFSTNAPPNVLLILDNSFSMQHIVWHPSFDPNAPTTCNDFIDTADYVIAKETDLTACGRTRTLFHDNNNPDTIYWGKYLNWLFSPEADAFYLDIEKTSNGFPSSCTGGSAFPAYQRSRLTTARQTIKDIICEVAEMNQIRFGFMIFRTALDPNGGFVLEPVDTYSSSQASDINSKLQSVTAETETPLSEALFQAYTYFMDRDLANIPFGQDGLTQFPIYTYDESKSGVGGEVVSTSKAPPSPIDFSCQKNFIILVSGGESTMDDFVPTIPTDTGGGFADFKKLIGDYNPDGEFEEPFDAVCLGCKTTLYLDDIAYYMQTKDMRPDLAGQQTIDTYTIGFRARGLGKALLEKTALVGNGFFDDAGSREEFAQALINAFSDIIRKSQTFTAATIPASRTSAGGQMFTTLFRPSDKSNFWEGHLRSYHVTASGEIHDRNGNCAVVDPTGGCFEGFFKPVGEAPPFWDAGEEVPAPASRTLLTSVVKPPGTPIRAAFDQKLSAAHLDVTFPPLVPYSGSTALNAEGLTDEIIENVRGCRLGTGVLTADVLTPQACVPRPWLMGDIFHSNPVVVGPPSQGVSSLGYHAFEATYATRKKVLYAGANDGFLRGILTGEWDPMTMSYDSGTGEELFGFMPWMVRKNIKNLPIASGVRPYYFVDGSPSVADTWFYSTPTDPTHAANGSDWHTTLIAGLRGGGEQYYALDVTDPDDPGYPRYLWEFPAENAPPGVDAYLGQTWSQPVITRIRVRVGLNDNGGQGFERWVAIFGGGYHPTSDPNDHNYDPKSTKGRAIFIVDVQTGELLAMKAFDGSGGASGPESEMLYAFASTPAVIDLNFDGYADLIYI
ncbi:MAG: pilus assembly protein, partial [Planctomycetota bacterium]